MKIYSFSKFYTLNILAYSIWVANFIYVIFFLFTLSQEICSILNYFDKYFVLKIYINYYIYYFYFVIFLIFCFLIEIILRKHNKISEFNKIYGNPKIANILFGLSILAIPITYFIFYKLMIFIDKTIFID